MIRQPPASGDLDVAASLRGLLADPSARKVAIALVGLLVVVVLVRLVQRAIAGRVADTQARYHVRKSVTFVGYAAALVVLASIYRDQLGGVGVALGVAGAGVAFALQEVIASVAGWVAVSLGGFYNVGDRVQLGGIKGDVMDIGILRTTVMEIGQWVDGDLYSGRIVRIANSFVFKEPVFNYSGDFPFVWDEIKLPIKYGTDHREARAILERVGREVTGEFTAEAAAAWSAVVKKYMIENAKVEPVVTVVANDNWIELCLRYTVDYKQRRSTKDRLFTRILDEVDASEGRVGLASATFHLVEAPVLDVRIRGPHERVAPPPPDAGGSTKETEK